MVVDVEVAQDQQWGIHMGKQRKRGDGPAGGGAGQSAVCVNNPKKMMGGIKESSRGVEVDGEDIRSTEVDREQGNCSQDGSVGVKRHPGLARRGQCGGKRGIARKDRQ